MSSSLTTDVLAEEEFDRVLLARTSQRRRERLEALGVQSVAWLALLPSWTKRLAELAGFPAREGGIEGFVAHAEAAGLCVSTPSERRQAAARAELRAVSALARYLPVPLAQRGLELVSEVHDDRTRARAIVDLAPALASAELLAEAVPTARGMVDDGARALALCGLAEAMSTEEAGPIRSEAVVAAEQTSDRTLRARVLAALCRSAPPEEQARLRGLALDAASGIEHAHERAAALAALAPLLGAAGVERAILALDDVADPGVRAELAVALAQHADAGGRGPLLANAASWAREAPERRDRDAALLGVVDALARSRDPEEAFRTASLIGGGDARALAFGLLARYAADEGDDAQLETAIARAEASLAGTVDSGLAVAVRAAIARMLASVGNAEQALTLVRASARQAEDVELTPDAVYPLGALAAALTSLGSEEEARHLGERALEAAMRVSADRERCERLLRVPIEDLAGDLRARTVAVALTAVEHVADPFDRLALLPALMPYLDARDGQRIVEQTVRLAAVGASELTFWMPDATRADVFSILSDRESSLYVDLLAEAGRIARAIRAAQEGGMALVPGIVLWATLAQPLADGAGAAGVARDFTARVNRAITTNDTPGALGWIEAGSALAAAVGEELAGAVRYARRRIELVNRRVQDVRHLGSFLERREQVRAFRKLMSDDGSGWALHYLGAGGVGKTMLLRYLTKLAADEGIATSRVDFDYLSPDYPTRRPGQLLLELMAELELYAPSEREEALVASFRDKVVTLHEVASEGAASDPVAYLDSEPFQSVLRPFCNFVEVLERPVVLILDTCEELAKFQPKGSRLPNVEAMFGVIERIQRALPDTPLRVIFAGRRLLARTGKGWSVAASSPLEYRELLPVERNYLRLYEIRGFTSIEAHAFLTRIKKLDVDADVEAAILDGSRDTGTVAEIDWQQAREDAPDEERFNPFDLDMYAEWVAEVRPESPSDIASADVDLYVDRRIVGRIRSDSLRALLPSVALLRCFDADILRPTFRGAPGSFDDAYTELTRQEWIDVRTDVTTGTTYLQVDSNLYPRLRAYYEHRTRRAEFSQAASALAQAVSRRIEAASLGDLPADVVNGALDVADPAEAASLWLRLVVEVARERHWDWAFQVSARLLGEEGSVSKPGHPAQASIRASLASALLHLGTSTDAVGHWRGVLAAAAAEPDEVIRAWLVRRARAGVVASLSVEDPLPPDDLAEFVQVLGDFPGSTPAHHEHGEFMVEQLAASCCAALEAVLERRHLASMGLGVAVARWVDRLEGVAAVSPPVRAFAQIVAAELLVRDGEWASAARRAEGAERLVAGFQEPIVQGWLDWIAPASLADRVRLGELIVVPVQVRPERLDEWTAAAVERASSLDAERLLSAILRLRLASSVVGADDLERLERAAVYDAGGQPQRHVHRVVAPLFVSLARGWLARGEADRALGVLDARWSAATASARDPATVRAAELGKLEVVRRMRMADAETVLVNRLARSPDPAEVEAGQAVVALTRPRVLPSDTAGEDESTVPWRVRTGLSPADRATLVDLGARLWTRSVRPSDFGSADRSFEDVSSQLDREEWLELSRKPRGSWRYSALEWAARHPSETEPAIRLMLRAAALGVLREPFDEAGLASASELGDPRRLPALWGEQIGYRLLGELALEEGELLALRLPEQAVPLLDLARRCFVRSGDDVGVLIATVREGIAQVHAREWSDDWLREAVSAAFRGAVTRRSLREAPTWPGLLERAADPSDDDVERLDHPVWAGWLRRLYLVLVWCQLESKAKLPQLAAFGVAPPVELDLDPSLGQYGRRHGVGKRLRTIGGLALGAAVGFGGVFAAVYLLRLGLRLVGFEVSLWETAGAFSALVAVVGLFAAALSSFRREVRAAILAQTALRLRVSTSSQTRGPLAWPPPQPIDLTLERRRLREAARTLSPVQAFLAPFRFLVRFPNQLAFLGPVERFTASWTTPPLGSYRDSLIGFPPEIADELRALRAELKGSVAIWLDVPAASAGIAWEGLLSLATSPEQETAGTIAPLRWAPHSDGERRRTGRLEGAIRVLCNPDWRGLVSNAWSAWPGPVSFIEDVAEMSPDDELAVLHLLGRPVSSPSGYLFQVGGDAPRGAALEASVRASGSIVRADSLPLVRDALVIVQAEPFETRRRVDTDRDNAAALKVFASDVFGAGARAVVTVPALPPQLASEVLAVCARRLRPTAFLDPREQIEVVLVRPRFDPVGLRLVRLGREARELVAGWPTRYGMEGLDPVSYFELSHDLCIYLHHHLREFADQEGSPPG